jgi:hypothetical protein
MVALVIRCLLAWSCCCGLSLAEAASLQVEKSGAASDRVWDRLLVEAERLHLPTAFLKTIPPDFIRFEFDDLHTYAAEYHPEEHRMVLNRSLSFHAAGGTLKSLATMTHKELDVLYHELFHAYMEYLVVAGERSAANKNTVNELLIFARKQQVCRYGEVLITPVVQRPDETESRYLTESESWEALNETWALFIGWAIWNQLEVQQKGGKLFFEQPRLTNQWLQRLESAFQDGSLRGYYVPEDPEERRVTHKRFLARQSQISWKETEALMGQVLGLPAKVVEQAGKRPGLASFSKQKNPCVISSDR